MARGEHQHRQVHAACSRTPAADRQSVDARHHHVEEHRRRELRSMRATRGLAPAIGGGQHRISLELQRTFEGFPGGAVVLGDENRGAVLRSRDRIVSGCGADASGGRRRRFLAKFLPGALPLAVMPVPTLVAGIGLLLERWRKPDWGFSVAALDRRTARGGRSSCCSMLGLRGAGLTPARSLSGRQRASVPSRYGVRCTHTSSSGGAVERLSLRPDGRRAGWPSTGRGSDSTRSCQRSGCTRRVVCVVRRSVPVHRRSLPHRPRPSSTTHQSLGRQRRCARAIVQRFSRGADLDRRRPSISDAPVVDDPIDRSEADDDPTTARSVVTTPATEAAAGQDATDPTRRFPVTDARDRTGPGRSKRCCSTSSTPTSTTRSSTSQLALHSEPS